MKSRIRQESCGSGIPRCAVLALVLVAGMAVPAGSELQAEVWFRGPERPAVDLQARLLDLEGRPANLTDFQERVLVVNFWATWCGPCLAEMPSLERLQGHLGGRGLRVVAVTDEPIEIVSAFLRESPYSFTILVNPDRTLARRLRIWSIPWTLVLDSRRRLVHFHQGARLWDTPDMIDNLTALLKE
jgi:thiol-disulfide isomerase/thioredoxin